MVMLRESDGFGWEVEGEKYDYYRIISMKSMKSVLFILIKQKEMMSLRG